MADVAVALLDGEGQVFSGEELILGNKLVKDLPVIGQEGAAFDPDFIEKLVAGCRITALRHPG